MPSIPCQSSYDLLYFKIQISDAFEELLDGRCPGNIRRNAEFWREYKRARRSIGMDLIRQGIGPPRREFYRLLADKTAKFLYRAGWWGYQDFESNDGCYTFERHFRLSRYRYVPS